MSNFTKSIAEVSTYRQKAEQIEKEARQPVIDKLSTLLQSINDTTSPDLDSRCRDMESAGRDLILFVCAELDIDQLDLKAEIGEQ